MIGRLSGRIVDEASDGDLIVDVNGVGYEVTAPLGTRGRLAADGTETVTFYIHTHVREDALQLFGFASLEEREAFRTIISIANVGPKLGIAILGAANVHDLAQMVARGETAKLTTIPGVGKKTAERLVLELKGKLAVLGPAPARPDRTPAVAPAQGTKAEMLSSALTRLGYRPIEADRAVAALTQGRSIDDVPIGELVREALAVLSR
ncbi:MAG: Holliday junction branch migration protein RuvA [Polyangiaceae bacterium]|nr:Holliday junction branch migration protein RuvA [Polyangiaceae bacterium]